MSTKRPKKRNKQTVAAQRARYQKQQEELAAAKSGKRKRDAKEIAVIVISVIVALGLMLPSLAQIFAQPQTQSIPTTIEGYQERYQPLVDQLQGELEADPTNADAELQLANTYFEWGSYARMFAGDDEFRAEVERVFGEAKSAYAKYVELLGSTDSEEAKQAEVSEALCSYYTGDTGTAIKDLTELAESTDFAPAWANLGMIYAAEGATNTAIECYEKGAAADPDNALDVKEYCEQQIESLTASADEGETTDDTSADGGDSAADDGSSTTDGSESGGSDGEAS